MRTTFRRTIALTSLASLAACGGTSESDEGAEAPTSVEIEAPVPQIAFADLTGDATKGELVFGQCQTCHSLEEGATGIGPSLHGLFGREAGSVEGYNYSAANADANFTWSGEVMFNYIESPREYLPGTRMAFPGLRDAQDRADLIAFLEANAGG